MAIPIGNAAGFVSPSQDDFIIGIIGMGDMGKMYAQRFSTAGWK
jgi:prephenate dehydrogenase (NADP+)